MSFGKMGTDREERINYERLREYRLARTREQMEKAGLGALITWEAWGSSGGEHRGHQRWL